MKMTQNAPRVHFCEQSRITTPSARPSCSRDTLTYFYARNAGALSAQVVCCALRGIVTNFRGWEGRAPCALGAKNGKKSHRNLQRVRHRNNTLETSSNL